MAARYWLGTISVASGWLPPANLPDGVTWIRGQRETGVGGFEHYQVFAAFPRPQRLPAVQRLLGTVNAHWEQSRSANAESYVWKEG